MMKGPSVRKWRNYYSDIDRSSRQSRGILNLLLTTMKYGTFATIWSTDIRTIHITMKTEWIKALIRNTANEHV